MNNVTHLPDLGRSQAMKFLEEHDQLKRELMLSVDENKQLFRSNVDLANENALLRDRLKLAEDRVVYLQGFSKTIITRFDVIKESVNALEAEARSHGIKVVKAPHVETAEEIVENESAREIVASLPAREAGLPVNKF